MKKVVFRFFRDLGIIIVGSVFYALGFTLFIDANHIATGGIVGISMMLNHYLPLLSIGTFVIILNIPLFILGFWKIGGRFAINSLIGTFLSSVFLDLATLIPPLGTEPLLSAIFGGIGLGVGAGLIFFCDGSTGGSDIITRLVAIKMKNASLGKVFMIVETFTMLLVAFVYRSVNSALYGIIVLYVSQKAIDLVLYGLDYASVTFIISDASDEISKAIISGLIRGVTILHGEGGYSGTPKNIVMCAIKRRQIAQIKSAVMQIDPNAFMIIADAHEVNGNGFEKAAGNVVK